MGTTPVDAQYDGHSLRLKMRWALCAGDAAGAALTMESTEVMANRVKKHIVVGIVERDPKGQERAGRLEVMTG